MKVAIVHEWLVTRAGSEKVVEEILGLYPDADLFTLICALPPGQDAMICGRKVTTSFLQRLWGARTRHRLFMPLMPLAIEQFDLSGYDLVISSSHAVAKGVITGPNQVHLSYVHSPMRYAWDLQHTYLAESGLTRGFRSALARLLLHYLRIWDLRTANGPERMIANSAYIARRIAKVYRRKADVVFPPVDIAAMPFVGATRGFLPRRLAHDALQAHGADRRGLRPHAGQEACGHRRRPGTAAGAPPRNPQHPGARLLRRCDPARQYAPRQSLRLRGGRGFRHHAGRGAGLRRAGHRLRDAAARSKR